MRVEIKTPMPIKDPDIKALYILNEGLKRSTGRMRRHNLKFIIEAWAKQLAK